LVTADIEAALTRLRQLKQPLTASHYR
jgi:hypothetical protein